MKKSYLALIVGLVAVGLVIFLTVGDKTGNKSDTPATSNDSTNSVSTVETNSVTITDFAFAPANITIKKGTTVTWTNQDSAAHTVTPDSPSDAFKGSELFGRGQNYSFTFDTPGTYAYHCTPHPTMKGTVVVTE